MKKLFILLVFISSFFQVAFAQSDMERLNEHLQQMQEQMNKMMEEFSQEFGDSFYHNFDTTIVRRFDMRDFDGDSFPFDTSWVREFHWDGFGDSPMQIDTFFIEEFRDLEPGEMPEFFNGGAFPQELQEMMERLMQNLQQFDGQGFNFDGMEEFFREYREHYEEGEGGSSAQPEEGAPSRKKKRKTTIL